MEQREIEKQAENKTVEALVSFLATNTPTLEALTDTQRQAIARLFVMDNLKDELKAKVEAAKVNWQNEKALFLGEAETHSPQTARAYKNGLKKLENYMGLNFMELTPAKADEFIYSLKKADYSPATIRQAVASCSAFFTFLERRYAFIRNPFRGTKATPKKKAVTAFAVPTDKEVEAILESVNNGILKAAFSIMAFRGLRVGALEKMEVGPHGAFITESKGKEIYGTLPPICLEYMKAAGILAYARPFGAYKTECLQEAVKYYTRKLFKEGKLAAAYSAHDLRHFYAISRYKQTKDIYQLSKELGHTSIAVTESYLKGLKVEL